MEGITGRRPRPRCWPAPRCGPQPRCGPRPPVATVLARGSRPGAMLNWLTRYAPVAAELRLDGSGRLLESVLDVGCGPHGLSIVAPEATFAGIDVMFGEPVAAHMVALCARPGPLPFADRAFDTVVCLDVVEHVAPGERAGFVAELARVAAHRVLVAC